MIPSRSLLVIVCLLLAGACYFMFNLWSAADERADRAEDRLIRQGVIAKITKEYVHEIQYLPVPESTIRSRVDRLCDQRLRENRSGPDGTAAPNPGDRGNRDLAGNLKNAWANTRQLAAIQRAARAAGCAD